jgi:hypothetical protein
LSERREEGCSVRREGDTSACKGDLGEWERFVVGAGVYLGERRRWERYEVGEGEGVG